ncbi:hypothetical protein Y032_0318g2335 [Ancylostoma ceylanicum]|uniref:Uncharacterized protein n=1 Tax=Ancylostoma ceylanicum TaxID=53326 RepID=A0A016S1V6_9BILA|nr:hypothetical protein Y032_0318g2335 [Ancylostoma ceylanicum]
MSQLVWRTFSESTEKVSVLCAVASFGSLLVGSYRLVTWESRRSVAAIVCTDPSLPPVFATVSKSTSLRRDCRINLIPAAAKKPERVLGIMAWTGQQKFLYL